MEILKFSILINTDKKTVWNTMLEDKTYREWTKAFMDGSYYDGSWEKGSEIRFLGADEHGKLQGIISRIKENRKYEFVSIEHFGLIKDGIVDTQSDEVKKWAPSFENYTFNSKENGTEVIVEMQVNAEFKAMFEEMWPRALNILKVLCEKQ